MFRDKARQGSRLRLTRWTTPSGIRRNLALLLTLITIRLCSRRSFAQPLPRSRSLSSLLEQPSRAAGAAARSSSPRTLGTLGSLGSLGSSAALAAIAPDFENFENRTVESLSWRSRTSRLPSSGAASSPLLALVGRGGAALAGALAPPGAILRARPLSASGAGGGSGRRGAGAAARGGRRAASCESGRGEPAGRARCVRRLNLYGAACSSARSVDESRGGQAGRQAGKQASRQAGKQASPGRPASSSTSFAAILSAPAATPVPLASYWTNARAKRRPAHRAPRAQPQRPSMGPLGRLPRPWPRRWRLGLGEALDGAVHGKDDEPPARASLSRGTRGSSK